MGFSILSLKTALKWIKCSSLQCYE